MKAKEDDAGAVRVELADLGFNVPRAFGDLHIPGRSWAQTRDAELARLWEVQGDAGRKEWEEKAAANKAKKLENYIKTQLINEKIIKDEQFADHSTTITIGEDGTPIGDIDDQEDGGPAKMDCVGKPGDDEEAIHDAKVCNVAKNEIACKKLMKPSDREPCKWHMSKAGTMSWNTIINELQLLSNTPTELGKYLPYGLAETYKFSNGHPIHFNILQLGWQYNGRLRHQFLYRSDSPGLKLAKDDKMNLTALQ